MAHRASVALERVLERIDQTFARTVADLTAFCAQPSISAHGIGMREMASLVAQRFRDLGADVSEHTYEGGYPIVFARLVGQTSRSLLFYNHYDVQPADPMDRWRSPPFEPVVRDGYFYARGAADNKGALVARLAAIRAYLETAETLPVSVRYVVEGEEEVGSPHLQAFVDDQQRELSGEGLIWEGASADQAGNPVLRLGNKGTLHVELCALGPNADAHARFGAIFPNPIWKLVWALAAVRRPDGYVLVPGFYEAVRPPSAAEESLYDRLAADAEPLLRRYGFTASFPRQPAKEMMVELYARPTCTITGISGGYEGPGSKTIVPASALAKLEFKLVPDQDPDLLLEALRSHLNAHGCSDVEMRVLSRGFPSKTPLDHPFAELVRMTGERAYGRPMTIEPTSSGTGPRYAFTRRLPLAVVAVGGTHAGSMIHGPNENVQLEEIRLHARHMATLMHAMAFGMTPSGE
jgi:acetylornithine deacetylase/succinyl-diaminopimelate desuccinylase-like protein